MQQAAFASADALRLDSLRRHWRRVKMRPIALLAVLFLACTGGCTRSAVPTPSPQPTASTTAIPPTPTPPGPTDPTAAPYAVSVDLASLGPECARLPEQAKHRTYSAAITPQSD